MNFLIFELNIARLHRIYELTVRLADRWAAGDSPAALILATFHACMRAGVIFDSFTASTLARHWALPSP